MHSQYVKINYKIENQKENVLMEKVRFINSDYQTLFEINNGDKIKIEFPNGEIHIKQVLYIDECHIIIKGEMQRDKRYHICEFAEKMERMNATYKPLD